MKQHPKPLKKRKSKRNKNLGLVDSGWLEPEYEGTAQHGDTTDEIAKVIKLKKEGELIAKCNE